MAPLVPIYYSKLWDTNYAAKLYDICEHFLTSIYFSIFKMEAPEFSTEARNFIATMGDWYVGEPFSYIIISGSNTVHMFPKIVHNRFVIEYLSFHNVTDSVYKKLVGPKRKGWPKFPLNLGSFLIPNSIWAVVLGDQIASLKLGFSIKIKHDPKGFLDAHFKKNHVKSGYVHEEVPDEFIYQGVNTFSEVLSRAKNNDEQSHILQHQHELRTRVLGYRAMELDLLEKVRKDREVTG